MTCMQIGLCELDLLFMVSTAIDRSEGNYTPTPPPPPPDPDADSDDEENVAEVEEEDMIITGTDTVTFEVRLAAPGDEKLARKLSKKKSKIFLDCQVLLACKERSTF